MGHIARLPWLGNDARHSHFILERDQVRYNGLIFRIESRMPIDFKSISINLRGKRTRDHAPYSVAAFLHGQRLGRTVEVEQNFAGGSILVPERDASVRMHFMGPEGSGLLSER